MQGIRNIILSVTVALVFFLILLFTLSSFGIHEDSPFHFMRGQYYLHKLLTGKSLFGSSRSSPVFFIPGQRISLYKPNASEDLFSVPRPFGDKNNLTIQKEFIKYLEKKNIRESFYKHDSWSGNYFDLPNSQGHPAISDVLMALSNKIFYEKFGILGDIEAYHLYIVIVTTLAVFFLFFFVQNVFGKLAALFSVLGFVLFPFYFAESHFNIKDPVQMGFFTIALISFYFYVTKNGAKKWLAFFLLAVFFALGTKWNIVFLPFIILPWLITNIKNDRVRKFFKPLRLIIFTVLSLGIPILLLYIFWPFLWEDTFIRIQNTITFYTGLALKNPMVDAQTLFSLPLGFSALSLIRIITMTPPIELIFLLVGLVTILLGKIKTKYKVEWLLIFWLLVPIFRVSRQTTDTAGSIRHFMEFVPSLAIISGFGLSIFCHKLGKILPKKFTITSKISMIMVYGIILSFTIIKFHPNQNVYFNFLAGGLPGASEKKLFAWQGSYDNPYRQAALWLNENVEPDAKIAFMDGTMLALSPLWLRPDINIGSYFSGFSHQGEYIASLTYPTSLNVFGYNYLERFLKPVYTLSIDNYPIMKIWQNNIKFLKPGYEKEMELLTMPTSQIKTARMGRYWEIAFDDEILLTRLIFKTKNSPGCRNLDGIWSVISRDKEVFFNPDELSQNKDFIDILFPGELAQKIRFLDTDETSCFFNTRLDTVMYIPSN